MTKEEVLLELNSNPYFKDFHKEFQGKFSLCYIIKGVKIFFYNTVGGYIDVWLSMSYDLYKIDEDVKDFITISKEILQQKLNSPDAYNPLK